VAAWYAIAAAATLLLLLPALSTDISRPIHRYLASMATLFTNKHLLSNVGVGAQVRALRTHTPLLRLQRLPRCTRGARRRKPSPPNRAFCPSSVNPSPHSHPPSPSPPNTAPLTTTPHHIIYQLRPGPASRRRANVHFMCGWGH
jgi:hypothetical protein